MTMYTALSERIASRYENDADIFRIRVEIRDGKTYLLAPNLEIEVRAGLPAQISITPKAPHSAVSWCDVKIEASWD